jgi:hypothetical protein
MNMHMSNIRHSGEGRNLFNQILRQIPAFAGMTVKMAGMTGEVS